MKARKPLRRSRGATMTEYALILVGVILIGAGAAKLLGGKISQRMGNAGDEATSSESHGGGGGGSGGGSGSQTSGGSKSNSSTASRSGGGGGSNPSVNDPDEKSSVAGKANVGGSHDKNAAPESKAAVDKNEPGGDANVAAQVDTSFGMRKGFALAMMALGVGTILFFLLKTRKAIKDVREAGK